MPHIELQIPARSPYVGVVRLALAALARAAGLDEERVDDVKIAVSEACSRAVLANESGDPVGDVSVSWSDDGSLVVIEISDRAGANEATDADNSLSFSSRAVMSEALLRSLMDGYESASRPDGGTTTRLLINH
ncbi:MAG: ATP-binding protein [Actinomycetota bacterium]